MLLKSLYLRVGILKYVLGSHGNIPYSYVLLLPQEPADHDATDRSKEDLVPKQLDEEVLVVAIPEHIPEPAFVEIIQVNLTLPTILVLPTDLCHQTQ